VRAYEVSKATGKQNRRLAGKKASFRGGEITGAKTLLLLKKVLFLTSIIFTQAETSTVPSQ